jgi:hypothetical protein
MAVPGAIITACRGGLTFGGKSWRLFNQYSARDNMEAEMMEGPSGFDAEYSSNWQYLKKKKYLKWRRNSGRLAETGETENVWHQ